MPRSQSREDGRLESEFSGLHAVITGGAGGIGGAAAKGLAKLGCSVTVTYLTDEEAKHFVRDPATKKIRTVQLDVTNAAGVTEFFDSLERIDILVNCAGVLGRIEEFEEEGFLNTMEVNMNGTMRCCYAARDLLSQRGGAIVNICSVMSFFGSGTAPGYATSKGAVMQFTRSLAVAWAELGIRVNALAPGFIDTPMTKGLQADSDWNTRVISRTPMGRWGKPEEMVSGILFLASPRSSFVTGVILPIDGGYTVKAVS